MHLTPEQIDRQPFKMRRRGYDIVQVRNFLREIAQEMRERQRARDELGTDGDPVAVARAEAEALLADARREADEIRAEARVAADGADLDAARRDAAAIRNEAQEAAEQLALDAEETARRRSDAVLKDTQTRLDALLSQEREVHHRLRTTLDDLQDSIGDADPPSDDADVIDLRDDPAEVPADSSLAEFMKAALRNELRD